MPTATAALKQKISTYKHKVDDYFYWSLLLFLLAQVKYKSLTLQMSSKFIDSDFTVNHQVFFFVQNTSQFNVQTCNIM